MLTRAFITIFVITMILTPQSSGLPKGLSGRDFEESVASLEQGVDDLFEKYMPGSKAEADMYKKVTRTYYQGNKPNEDVFKILGDELEKKYKTYIKEYDPKLVEESERDMQETEAKRMQQDDEFETYVTENKVSSLKKAANKGLSTRQTVKDVSSLENEKNEIISRFENVFSENELDEEEEKEVIRKIYEIIKGNGPESKRQIVIASLDNKLRDLMDTLNSGDKFDEEILRKIPETHAAISKCLPEQNIEENKSDKVRESERDIPENEAKIAWRDVEDQTGMGEKEVAALKRATDEEDAPKCPWGTTSDCPPIYQ